MNVKVSAYWSDDGSGGPDSVDVEWTEVDSGAVGGETLLRVLDRLLSPPATRSAPTVMTMTVLGPTDVEADNCQRLRCGHPHELHGRFNDAGWRDEEDDHAGACTVCRNTDKCRSFVGRVKTEAAS